MSDEAKDLYVSSVEGHLVTRFGTNLLIGASRDPADSKITWDTALVVKLLAAELVQYGREYRRALRDGSLVLRTKAEFDQQQGKYDEAVAKQTADFEAAAAKASAAKPLKPKTGPARGAEVKE